MRCGILVYRSKALGSRLFGGWRGGGKYRGSTTRAILLQSMQGIFD